MSISVMKKLTVISPLGAEDAVVKRLIRLRCIEVRSAYTDDYSYLLDSFSSDEKRVAAEKLISIIERVTPELNKYTKRKGGFGDRRLAIDRDEFISDGRYAAAVRAAEGADECMKKIAACKAEILCAESDIASLKPWMKCDLPLNFSGTENTRAATGVFPAGTTRENIADALENTLAAFEVVHEDNSGVYAEILMHKEDAESAMRALNEIGFSKIQFSEIEERARNGALGAEESREKSIFYGESEGTARQLSGKLTFQIAALRGQIEGHLEAIRGYSEYLNDIEVVWDIEKTNIVAAESESEMARTEKCAVLSAWVPEKCCERVGSALDKLCCAYDISDPPSGEEPPVLLENNGYASNFEWVVGMYSYPKYGSFDPTFIMSIFYFFIFGLMFADVGYGLLMALGGFLIPKVIHLSPSMKRSFNMFGYCGIAGMIMGVLFGGWFGDLPYAIMQNFMGMENAKDAVPFFNGIIFNPIDEPMGFLIVSLAAGGVHLIAGMAVKFVLLCKEGKVADAIFDIGSWWIVFAGIAVIALVGAVPGAIVCGIGVLMIILTHGRNEKNIVMKLGKGLLGLYDITSYASDLLSYSRILALGLAAAVIAQVINLIGTMGGPTVGGFIALVLVFIIGHGLNLAINILGSFVHTSRLQYLEFFNKFYEDGGREFKSAEPSEKYSIDTK